MNKTVAIVGSGPNGLMAAIILSNSGYKVKIIDSYDSLGGGLRSFVNPLYNTTHDICSAVHPMAVLSPAFRSIGLHKSVSMVSPPRPFAHAFNSCDINNIKLRQLYISKFAGVAAHGMVDPFSLIGIGIGATLYSASKIVNWPIPIGGSQNIINFLISKLNCNNVDIILDTFVDKNNYDDYLSDVSSVIWDTTPDIPLQIISSGTYKPRKSVVSALKVDYVVDAPIPWIDQGLFQAGTIHLGGKYSHIREIERKAANGIEVKEPFVILSQPTLFDSTRAPEGTHTVWAYAHVPSNSYSDAQEVCSRVIEKYAPGFSNTILYAKSSNIKDIEKYNPNYKYGDILSGSTYKSQMFPNGIRKLPWVLPKKNWFMCSSAVFPGPGVHGLGGMAAAKLVMKYT